MWAPIIESSRTRRRYASPDGARWSRTPGALAQRPTQARLPSLAGLQARNQRLQSRDLRRPGRRDRLPLRLPTTWAEVNSGDVPEDGLTVVGAWPDGPTRHLRHGVVDGCPCAFPLVLLHCPSVDRAESAGSTASRAPGAHPIPSPEGRSERQGPRPPAPQSRVPAYPADRGGRAEPRAAPILLAAFIKRNGLRTPDASHPGKPERSARCGAGGPAYDSCMNGGIV